MITNNFLVTDSGEAETEALISFWQTLKDNNFDFSYQGSNSALIDYFAEQKQEIIRFVWPKYPSQKLLRPLYWLASPYWLLVVLLHIHDLKPRAIITTGLSDSLLIALLGRLMNFKHYWLLLPELQSSVFKFKLLRRIIRKTIIFVYSSLAQSRLEQLAFKNKVVILLPSYVGAVAKHQENIFSTLAHKEYPQRKFFTIGTFTDLTTESHLENLLKAAKDVREVVPNLQIIIVGDGPEKKNLLWLAKTLGIESTVWFVGSTEKTFKWLENLDLYIHTKPRISLKEQLFALDIMCRKIPMIADVGVGLDDLIFDGKTGRLVLFKNISELAQTIISLEQDIKLRAQLGEEGKKRVADLFCPQKALDQFSKVL